MLIRIEPSSNPKPSHNAEFQLRVTAVTQTGFAHENKLSDVLQKTERRQEILIFSLHSEDIQKRCIKEGEKVVQTDESIVFVC